jgi:Zn-dependent protease with chaperone function
VTDAAGYAAVPGPADRESFLAAQARHRRASGWFTALSATAITLMGIPLSAVISPLVYAAALLVVDLLDLVGLGPHLGAAGSHTSSSSNAPVTPAQVVLVVALLVLPGSLVLLFSWLGVRRMFRNAGAGATVLALGARPPRTGDLEEHQLANVVGEMAAAAGIPPPGVMILDSDVPNAAAVGTRHDDATIVVTTGLLRTLDRDETQGVIGHLVGSVGNGDLRIGSTISSVFQTLGLVGSVLSAPAAGRPRVTLRRLIRYAFHRPGADDTAAVADLLLREGADPAGADDNAANPSSIRAIATMPFLVAGMAFQMTSYLFGFVLVNPFIRSAWRARRYLADASAVDLTRNPDGLARALSRLATAGAIVPGTAWAAHLFVVGGRAPVATDGSPMATFQPLVQNRLERLRRMGATVPVPAGGASVHRTKLIFYAVTSPCWLAFGGLMIGLALLLTMVSLMVDSLFLAPMVALIHALLRHLAS